MPTYVYETIPSADNEEPQRFELKQSMKDDPLEAHPETGEPVRRVISGGYGFQVSGSAKSSPKAVAPSNCCSGRACDCQN